MKILQLNAWGGRLDYALTDYIEKEAPDVICLQEAISLDGGKAGLFTTIEEIKKAARMDYIFMSPTFSFNMMNRVADFGNCVISKYPILTQKTVFTNGEYKRGLDWGVDDLNMRNFQHVVVNVLGIEVNIVNHHGYVVPEHKNGNELTLKQCIQIASYVEQLNGPVVVAGDFNLVPESPSLEKLNSKLCNLTLENGIKTTRTSLTKKTEPCDYIFTSRGVEVKSFYNDETVVSDHQPLIAELIL